MSVHLVSNAPDSFYYVPGTFQFLPQGYDMYVNVNADEKFPEFAGLNFPV